MNNSIYPCLWFNKNGGVATAFYCGIFPNTTVTQDNGMVQMLSINGQNMMLLNGGPQFKPNPSISFLIATEDEQETERLYNKLAEGGIALMPLDSYPFSKKYGWVRDQFGITLPAQHIRCRSGHSSQLEPLPRIGFGIDGGVKLLERANSRPDARRGTARA